MSDGSFFADVLFTSKNYYFRDILNFHYPLRKVLITLIDDRSCSPVPLWVERGLLRRAAGPGIAPKKARSAWLQTARNEEPRAFTELAC